MDVGQFLCNHFADPRIVHASSKDTLIQALANFVCNPNTLHYLEELPVDRYVIVKLCNTLRQRYYTSVQVGESSKFSRVSLIPISFYLNFNCRNYFVFFSVLVELALFADQFFLYE